MLGEWFSNRCEVRQLGQFLTRHIRFNADRETWEGFFHYFADDRCSQSLFTVQSRGSYMIGRKSEDIDDAFQFDVKLNRMWLTAQDARIVNLLSEDMGGGVCAQSGSWRAGARQDVTSTGGCAMLGLKVPVMAFELIRLEREHHKTLLYMGQGHTIRTQEMLDPSDLPSRSNSFQAPLVWCGSVTSQQNTTQNHPVSDNTDIDLEISNDVTDDVEGGEEPEKDSFNVKYLKLKPQFAMQTDTQAESAANSHSVALAAHLLTFGHLTRWLLYKI